MRTILRLLMLCASAFAVGCDTGPQSVAGAYRMVQLSPKIEGSASSLHLAENGDFTWITRFQDQDEARGTYLVGGDSIFFEVKSWSTSGAPHLIGLRRGRDVVLILDEHGTKYEMTFRKLPASAFAVKNSSYWS